MSNEESLQWLETMIDAGQRQDPDLFSRSLRPSPPRLTPTQKPSQEIELLRTLGEGGMGQVFLARQNSLDRQVAVKAIKPSQVGEYAQLAMLHEARIAGALEHPNVVPIHSLSHDEDGLPLLVMKRIDGTSWKDLLKNPRHPYWLKEPQERLQQNLEILMQVCNALHFAHTKGIIHRDIKPENVMLGNFGEIYLLDWGIAVHLENGSAPVEEIAGTLSYVAPEMIVRGARLTPRTDIYLVGATLYEVLTGETLHKSKTLLDVVRSTAQKTRRTYPVDTPEPLVDLCESMIAIDPEKRPESMRVVRQALASFLQRRALIELATTAQKKLTDLTHRSSQGAEVYRLSGEIQFGFEQARRGWPENELSTKGLLALAEYMAEFEISQRNVAAAKAHLALLPSPPERLTKSIAALEQALTEERNALEKLKALEYQKDTEVSAGQRVLVMIAGNINFLGGILLVSYLSPVEIWRAPPIYPLLLQLLFGIGAVGIAAATRAYFFRNDAGRQIYLSALLLSTMLLLGHLASFLMSLPSASVFLFDILLWALCAGILGIFFASIFLWNSIANALLLFIGVLAPWLSPWLLWLSFFLMTISVAKQWSQKNQGAVASSQ